MAVGERCTFHRKERKDRVTGRLWIQLTSGEGFTYPLYYFGPTLTRDGRALLFHRFRHGEVQNWKLDISSGEAVQLTGARTPNCLWRFWDQPAPAQGVRDLMSAFDPAGENLLYFDGNLLRAVHIDTLEDRVVYEVPPDRVPCGIPGVSPDGRWLTYVHADREWWETATQNGPPPRWEAKGVRLDVVELASGEARPIVVMNAWLTHANFYDERRIIFSNHPTECSIFLTDLRGGWYVHLRTQTVEGWQANHFVATQRGIMYETISPGEFGVMGVCDPETYSYREFRTDHPVSHLGYDPEGRLWFGHVYRLRPRVESFLAWLPGVRGDRLNPFVPLTEGMTPYGKGQHSHLHPVLTPDRRHILFTGPDETTETNHIFLLDVSDLSDTETAVSER